MAINRDKVLEAAQKWVEKKKYDKAVLELQRLVQADPNDARTLLKIGDLQAKQGLHGDAISTYESVGKLYSQQGFALKAIAVYKQIREIIAKHVPHLEERYGHITPKLAELYQQLGLTSDALAALDEVATRLQRQQKDPEAIEVFRKIVELDPTNPLPHLRLAEALSRVRDVDGAVFEFKTAASQLAGIGRRDDALKVLERLLHHKPDAEQARVCAELYLSRGQPQDGMQALAKLQICFQANPRDFDTLSLLARAFNAIGQGAKAIEVQKEMARVARDTGKTDLFREIVERLLRVAPHDDGVKKLAAQSGSAGSASGSSSGYGQNMPANPYASGGYPPTQQAYQAPPQQAYQAPPQQQQQPHGLQRPGTAPIARPMSAPEYGDGGGRDDVDELSYEEVEADEIVEEAEAYEQQMSDEQQMSGYPPREETQDYQAAGDPYETAVGEAEAEAEVSADSGDVTEHLTKIIADANAFRRVRLYPKALETLRMGLELEPRSMDVHEVYRDVLIEAGQTEEAVQEMLVIASLYVDSLDGESAARALQDVLAFDPQNARAIEMLQELGYEIVDENEEQAQPEQQQTEYGEDPATGEAERLPSYDLEEMGPSDVSAEYEDVRQVHVARGGQEEEEAGDALPSFPLDEPEAGHETAHQPRTASKQPSVAPASLGQVASRDLEDALDEAEFFCSRGLYDDARLILTEQLSSHPKNPLLRERLAEIDAQEAQRGSGAREKPRQAAEQDRAFDIAASLDALESLGDEYAQPAEGHAGPDEQVDVEEVFAKFKEGVAKQISVDDSDSHYNLGIAYKEMMLLDDAVREFDVAARDPKRECVCRSMIGMIYIEQGKVNEAIDAFLQGLNAPVKDPQQETVLCFEIGAAYEAKKMNKDALSYYQKAMRRDPNYRDVQERVRRLAKNEPKAPLRQAAVGADDEFDRAFDDLMKG